MGDISLPSALPFDRAADCHVRAAADRVEAGAMDNGSGRRALEQSAAGWDQRGALLGRLDASFDKRERLDAEATRFHAGLQAERRADAAGVSQWEDEGGATLWPRPSGDDPEVETSGGTEAKHEPMEEATPTSLQALGYATVTAIIALPVMMLTYRWFTA